MLKKLGSNIQNLTNNEMRQVHIQSGKKLTTR